MKIEIEITDDEIKQIENKLEKKIMAVAIGLNNYDFIDVILQRIYKEAKQ